ncbi:MAG TPA: enoyl-CoA hydratase/isomerase family protein [Bryobacteraceae bacterium]|nr:enoyl-CoA hydratase/isomerase family protein [Bryobacteraceae bacterium]
MGNRIETRREGRLLHIGLNRPEKRNALDLAMCGELVAAIEEAAADRGVGAILLTGNGKAFCAGMDLDEILTADTGVIDDVHERLFSIGSRIDKPLVAAVHGATLAGGTGLAANCHLVVAEEDARFGLTEIRIGLWPFLIFRAVAAALGERRAVELALTGRIFGAEEALRYGLVHHVASQSEAWRIAAEIADASPTAIRAGMESVRESRGKSWGEAGEIARRRREEVFRSPGFREGVRGWRK